MVHLHEALDLALRLHREHTWPGSRIPYAAHALEAACRVAALGGEEETIVAALLHDARRDREAGPLLEEFRAAFGERVAGLLETCWTRHLLPHGGWEGWLDEAWNGLDDTELRLLIACDALATFRNILLDWQVLARLYDESSTRDPSDHVWLTGRAGLPGPDQFTRYRWIPPDLEQAPTLRGGLEELYRSWLSLPLGDPAALAGHPSLALAHQGEAWARWVDRQDFIPLLRAWGFQGLAKEGFGLLGALSGLPGQARAGFLRRSAEGTEFMTPAVAEACLTRMTLVDLMLVLRNQGSALVRAFAAHVPRELQRLCGMDVDGRELATLSLPILLHWLGEVAREGLLTFPPHAGPAAPAAPVPAFPATDRYRKALALLLAEDEAWPGTTIPYAFHALEVSSLVLTAGWDEETAILALLHDLPRTEGSLARVGEALGTDAAMDLQHYWTLEGPAHRIPGSYPPSRPLRSAPRALQVVGLMDAVSLLRFVAEDFLALAPDRSLRRDPSREELTRRFTFFRGLIHDKPLGVVAENVMIGSRFGPTLLAWRQALPTFEGEPDLVVRYAYPRNDRKSGELRALFSRLDLPLPEVAGLVGTLEALSPRDVEQLVREVGPERLVEAVLDENWDRVWKALRAKLDPQYSELLAWQFLAPLPDSRATRRAQTAFLTVVDRMRRNSLLGEAL